MLSLFRYIHCKFKLILIKEFVVIGPHGALEIDTRPGDYLGQGLTFSNF